MNAVDTNVLVYARDPRDPPKQQTAKSLIAGLSDGVLLWQVACEYLAASRKLEPLGYDWAQAWQDLDDLRAIWTAVRPQWNVLDRANDLHDSYSLSSWDALIVAACLEAGVERLYTEDFGGYSRIENLEIVNPFVAPGREFRPKCRDFVLPLDHLVFSSRIPLNSLAVVCRSLATMLHSGIAIDRAVAIAGDKAGDPRCRAALAEVNTAIRRGEQVSAALREQGDAFPELMIDLVDVGEQTGTLPEVLKSLSGHYENLLRLKRNFRRQIAWPMFQLVAAILVIAMVIWILGWISQSRGGEPMDITGLGLTGGSGAILWLVMTFGGLFGLFIAYKVFSQSLSRKKWLDSLLLQVPVVGRCLRSFAIARFSWAFALTQQSGMSIAPSLKASLKATANGAYIDAGPGVWQLIREGHPLSEALAATRLFPRDYIETVSVAETSGTVPEMLDHLSPQFEEEARRDLQGLTAALGWAVWAAVAVFIIILIFNIFSVYLNALQDAGRGI